MKTPTFMDGRKLSREEWLMREYMRRSEKAERRIVALDAAIAALSDLEHQAVLRDLRSAAAQSASGLREQASFGDNIYQRP